jgi:hypothetical protein
MDIAIERRKQILRQRLLFVRFRELDDKSFRE